MRIIIWIVALLTALYSGYWFVAARVIRSETAETLDLMRAEGRGDYEAVSLGGFPYRFDLTVTKPRLVSGALTWSAPDLRLYALSYRPQHVIAVLPGEQVMTLGTEVIRISAARMEASAEVGLSAAMPLSHAESVTETLVLASDQGWGLEANAARAAIRTHSTPLAYDIGVELTGLSLTGTPAALVTTGGLLPATGDRIYLNAIAGFDRPLDRYAPAAGLRLLSIDIAAFSFDWGPLQVTAEGKLARAADGTPEGQLSVTIEDWKSALSLATDLGLVDPRAAETAEKLLRTLAMLSGDADRLRLPLAFRGGMMFLGPVPLGPAPRL